MNNFGIVRECRHCLDLLSVLFTSVSLVWVSGYTNIRPNCGAKQLAGAGALFPKSSSIELGVSINSVKLDIERKFFGDANLSWVNEESCSAARITWLLMDRRHTNQLLGLGYDVISTTVAVITCYCIVERHAERIRLAFTDFCRGCRSTEEEETVIHFLCQCPSLARCKLFVYPFLVSLTKLSSGDINHIDSYIKITGWFISVG